MVLLVLVVNSVIAQQEPTYTQYYFNNQVVNPAYAGTWNNLGFLVIGRHQWAGMDGAPTTYTLSVQSPTRFRNVALGLNVISDRAGFENRQMANLDYSYRVQLNRQNFLRLGIKAGITSYSVDFSRYQGYPGDPADPAFMGEIKNKIMPNFGVGGYLYNEHYYLGLSMPRILKSEFRNNFNNHSVTAEMRHLFLTGGYVFELNRDLHFKPTFLSRFVWGAPTLIDLTANFLIKEHLWLGANYRINDSFGFIAQWLFDNQLRVGYAVDFSIAKLRSFQNGTHEVMVSYELGSRRNWSSPRKF